MRQSTPACVPFGAACSPWCSPWCPGGPASTAKPDHGPPARPDACPPLATPSRPPLTPPAGCALAYPRAGRPRTARRAGADGGGSPGLAVSRQPPGLLVLIVGGPPHDGPRPDIDNADLLGGRVVDALDGRGNSHRTVPVGPTEGVRRQPVTCQGQITLDPISAAHVLHLPLLCLIARRRRPTPAGLAPSGSFRTPAASS